MSKKKKKSDNSVENPVTKENGTGSISADSKTAGITVDKEKPAENTENMKKEPAKKELAPRSGYTPEVKTIGGEEITPHDKLGPEEIFLTGEADSVKEEIRIQIAKVAKLPFKQKIRHFWYYYKIHFFVALGLLAFIVYLVLHFTVFAPKPYSFCAYAINSSYIVDITSAGETEKDRFLREFVEYEGLDTEKHQVELNTDMSIEPGSGNNLDIALDYNFTAAATDGDVDILMGPGEIIDFYVPNGFYHDTIDHYLPSDFAEYLAQRDLYYYYVDENGDSYAVGVYFKDAARAEESGLYRDQEVKPVVAIVSNYSPRMDVAVDFIEYMFDYPACLNQ